MSDLGGSWCPGRGPLEFLNQLKQIMLCFPPSPDERLAEAGPVTMNSLQFRQSPGFNRESPHTRLFISNIQL